MAKAGRPPLEPRIAKLEKEFADLKALIARIDVPRETVTHRLDAAKAYQPAFDKWPSNER